MIWLIRLVAQKTEWSTEAIHLLAEVEEFLGVACAEGEARVTGRGFKVKAAEMTTGAVAEVEVELLALGLELDGVRMQLALGAMAEARAEPADEG
jgi:hypothetical protein